ncbi:hypothetical protein BS47DRAFT_1357118 [Hydnum rufescens UP504]|uniref:Retrotransposon gag domain-containing protein n=1 Tax=Hydnum rufescens UP504 TaxID=1448309 RepID=A0A9P6E2L4_9AGAM|nr:hypothetical protein BS47DRAFT_1357118 [Hydnum rufescens UP504]
MRPNTSTNYSSDSESENPDTTNIRFQPIPQEGHEMISERDAPKFTGRNLREFLADYEVGTGEAGWDESQKCKQLPLYCKKAVRDLTSTFEEVTSGHGWDALKKRLSDLYQPDYHKPHYTRRDIERFINKKQIISKHSHFAQYYCDFMTKVQYVRPKPLNSEDKNLFFWEGLPRSLQKDIYEDLKIFAWVQSTNSQGWSSRASLSNDRHWI